MIKQDQANSYNGWTNYETWAVALWLRNDQISDRYWTEATTESRNVAPTSDQVREQRWTIEEATRYLLADRIKEETEDSSPLVDDCSLYSDLLTAALSDVNWSEIAINWLEDTD